MKLFYKLIQGDCLEVLPTLDEESVNLIITSPPYNLGKDYGKGFDDKKVYTEYLLFLSKVWKECFRVLRYNGRICVNIGDINKGFFRQPTHSHIIAQLEKTSFRYRDFVVWNKMQVRKRTAWGSFKSPANPYLISPFEFVIIFSKRALDRFLQPSKPDITKEEFIEWTESLWRFPPETQIKWHPSSFPEELPRRLIKLYSFPGDVVLDPFLGAGTTMRVAFETRRSCIGIEINEEYIKMIKERVGFGQRLLEEDIKWEALIQKVR